MNKNRYMTILLLLVFLFFQNSELAYGVETSDYLIENNIGDFLVSSDTASGNGPGILVGSDHFYIDHSDRTYEIDYFNLKTKAGPEIQIEQHSGLESDKWLSHETDDAFRADLGLPDTSYSVRALDGNVILVYGGLGWEYRWLSGNKVIKIASPDIRMINKPEPLVVVRAYLSKHPSSLPSMTSATLRTSENKTKWIKDEIDRRLWLCDKWFTQLQQGHRLQREVIEEVTKSMVIFLSYREKYFKKFGLLKTKAADEKMLISNLASQQSTTTIKNKLEEYKKWWRDNKDKSISF